MMVFAAAARMKIAVNFQCRAAGAAAVQRKIVVIFQHSDAAAVQMKNNKCYFSHLPYPLLSCIPTTAADLHDLVHNGTVQHIHNILFHHLLLHPITGYLHEKLNHKFENSKVQIIPHNDLLFEICYIW